MALPMKVVFAALAAGILVWGVLDCITNFEQNGCEMTWMFEYPKYLVRICIFKCSQNHLIQFYHFVCSFFCRINFIILADCFASKLGVCMREEEGEGVIGV